MRTLMDLEIETIHQDILKMADLVDEALVRNFEAFAEHDLETARQAAAHDDKIDQIHNTVENLALKTIALHQPAARDLRTVMAGLLVSTELERMGDYTQGIARRLLRTEDRITTDVPDEIPQMIKTVRKMLRRTMKAYDSPDASKSANRVRKSILQDNAVDELYAQLFEKVVTQMRQGELSIHHGTYLLWVGHSIERIGDRVTNICERIEYIRTGTRDSLDI